MQLCTSISFEWTGYAETTIATQFWKTMGANLIHHKHHNGHSYMQVSKKATRIKDTVLRSPVE